MTGDQNDETPDPTVRPLTRGLWELASSSGAEGSRTPGLLDATEDDPDSLTRGDGDE